MKIFVTLTAKRIFFASGEEEFRPEQRQNILSHSLPSNQSWTGVCMITHNTATKTVVALARETFAFEEAGVTGTLVGHVLALGVDALGEEFYGTHMIAGNQYSRRFFQTFFNQG